MRESAERVPVIHSVLPGPHGLWMALGKMDWPIGAKAAPRTVPATALRNIMSFSTSLSHR